MSIQLISRNLFKDYRFSVLATRKVVSSPLVNIFKRNLHPKSTVATGNGLFRSFSSKTLLNERWDDKINEGKKRTLEVLDKTNKLGQKKVQEFTQKTVERSRKMTENTRELSKQIRNNTEELRQNIKKIIPPEIHENIYTIPNILTFTRLITAPMIGYFIVYNEVSIALSLFVYSCITDFLDGFIARKYNLKSVVGTVIDPLADKTLMTICTVCLAKASTIPTYMAVLILGRDILLGLSAIFIRYKSLPAPKTFLRYWDFSIPSAEVHPTMISKVNTALQMVYIGCMMVKPVFLLYLSEDVGGYSDAFLSFTQGLEYVVATTTVLSGLSYVFSKNAVKYLNKPTN
ncbi:hypothetical protein B5S32_g1160 [[Candida] boidinii]|nr:hypothetical protein B5S29_g857 [[Candida] boidinii]OWB77002.1 hypothetical protein B5S32_g1160 [[Candida] boidinii]GME96404.1 unnamed protein product [[Candida] boidinii]